MEPRSWLAACTIFHLVVGWSRRKLKNRFFLLRALSGLSLTPYHLHINIAGAFYCLTLRLGFLFPCLLGCQGFATLLDSIVYRCVRYIFLISCCTVCTFGNLPLHHFRLLCFAVCWCCFLLVFCLDEDCDPGWGDCGRPLRRVLCCRW